MILSQSQWHPGLVSDFCITQDDMLTTSDELVKFHDLSVIPAVKGGGNNRLYMPESPFDEEQEARRKENWVPEELDFQTKDATFGSDNSFLDALPVGKERWLFMQKNADGQIQYALSNAPRRIKFSELVKASTMRWSIEQFFQDAKFYLSRNLIAYESHRKKRISQDKELKAKGYIEA